MPPLAQVEDYLALLAAVETTAESLKVKLVLEGYPPPRDPRLTLLQVTPDPGVIEVNIHPASHWEELVERTEYLYQAAHETRLSTENSCSTAATPAPAAATTLCWAAPPRPTALPSPPGRAGQPDCLLAQPPVAELSVLWPVYRPDQPGAATGRGRAMIRCTRWTSPCRKSARRWPARAPTCPPWLIDRILRNLLVDVTGNTHRAEFCIDKLYFAGSTTGRLACWSCAPLRCRRTRA